MDVDTSAELLKLEKGLWTGDRQFYREHADENCLVAFVGMTGLLTRDDLVATVKDDDRWQNVKMDIKGIVTPAANVVVLSYEASASKAKGKPHTALCSSGYIRRSSGWKLFFHTQGPAETGKAKAGKAKTDKAKADKPKD